MFYGFFALQDCSAPGKEAALRGQQVARVLGPEVPSQLPDTLGGKHWANFLTPRNLSLWICFMKKSSSFLDTAL